MVAEFTLLIIGSYLLGSVPTAYLAGKAYSGIDVRRSGSGNIGASNLLTITSKRITAPVIFFDLTKGMVFVLVAWAIGLGAAQQIIIGIAATIGHNWPIFLRFNGGRGILTTAGVAFLIPWLNGFWPWAVAASCGLVLISVIATHSTVTGVGTGIAAMPLVSWIAGDPFPYTMGLLAMLLIMVFRRLTVPRDPAFASVGYRQLILNRLFFDRDVRDKQVWMSRFDGEIGADDAPISEEVGQGEN